MAVDADSAAKSPPRTVLDFLKAARVYLERSGSPSPRLDAEVLLAHVLRLSRMALYTRFEQPLNRDEVDGYRQALMRRARREPVAYITGTREFYGLPFEVGPGVLVPRPETEYLVELALAAVDMAGGPVRGVDVGTGSGILALTLVTRRPDCAWVGIDRSAAALEFARRNAERLKAGNRVAWLRGDGVEALGDRSLDVMLSNPPYIPEAELPKLAPEIRLHEPREALDGGPDGMRLARRLVEAGERVLRPGGVLLMELGTTHQAQTLAVAACGQGEARGYRAAETLQDPVSGAVALALQTAGTPRPGWAEPPWRSRRRRAEVSG